MLSLISPLASHLGAAHKMCVFGAIGDEKHNSICARQDLRLFKTFNKCSNQWYNIPSTVECWSINNGEGCCFQRVVWRWWRWCCQAEHMQTQQFIRFHRTAAVILSSFCCCVTSNRIYGKLFTRWKSCYNEKGYTWELVRSWKRKEITVCIRKL